MDIVLKRGVVFFNKFLTFVQYRYMTFRRMSYFFYVNHARETWYKTMSENCSNATEMLMNDIVETIESRIYIYIKE